MGEWISEVCIGSDCLANTEFLIFLLHDNDSDTRKKE